MKRLYKRENGLTVSYNPYSKPKYILPRRADWDFWDNKRYTYNDEILPDNTLPIIGSEDDYKLSYFKDDNGHYWDGGYVLLPEIEVNRNLTYGDWCDLVLPHAYTSLQRSLDIANLHPEIYGDMAKGITPEDIRNQVDIFAVDKDEYDKDKAGTGGYYLPGSKRIVLRFGEKYDIKNDIKKNLAHEFNHALYYNRLLGGLYGNTEGAKMAKNILHDAYPDIFDVNIGLKDPMEMAASNATVRDYLLDNGFDISEYNFLSWDKDGAHSNLPELDAYLDVYRYSWEQYANKRYSELINERGDDHADEIKQEITDEANLKIRKALSTIAYNQTSNYNSPLYAKSGGILRFWPGGNTGLTVAGKGNLAKKATGFVSKNIYIPILGAINKISPTVAKFLGYNRAQEDEALRRAMEESPKVTNIENDNKPANTTQQFKNNVQRALKISKSKQFENHISELGLDDEISQELVSRYNKLDLNKLNAERDILINLAKNDQIHSITDFDLAIDKIAKCKEAKDPNLYKYHTLFEFDSEHTKKYFQQKEEKRIAKELTVDNTPGFHKLLSLPNIGLTVYGVSEDPIIGQTNLAHLMKLQYPNRGDTWCVLETDKNGRLTERATALWSETFNGPKYVLVDKNGRIKYFKSGNEDFFDLQDSPIGFIRNRKQNVTTYFSVIGDKVPFRENIAYKDLVSPGRDGLIIYDENEKPMYVTLHYPSTTHHIDFSNPRNNCWYEIGPDYSRMGTWGYTPSGRHIFTHNTETGENIYDENNNLLRSSAPGGYTILYDPQFALVLGRNRAMLFNKNDYNRTIGIANGKGLLRGKNHVGVVDYVRDNLTPLYEETITGNQANNGIERSSSFKSLKDAILLLGFKYPLYKKGGRFHKLFSRK